jgi:hypothetical protein
MRRSFIASPVVARCRPRFPDDLGRLATVFLLACMALAWAGCGTHPASASVTPHVTSSPTSSPALGPVQVGITLRR